MQALPKDMAVRVREGKPKTIKEASEMADNYELARTAAGGGAVQRQQQGLDQTSNAGSGASAGKMKPQGPPPRAGLGIQRSRRTPREIFSAGSVEGMVILLFLAQTGRHKVVKGLIVNQY